MSRCIVVEALEKRYGDFEAVKGLSFDVEWGEVFALLGPNGAGKTTTVEILEGHRSRSGGRVEVLGVDPEHGGRDFLARVGIVLQEAGIEANLTVREALEWFGDFYPSPRPIDEVIDLVGLAKKRSSRINTLSGGQRRRLDLALSLVGDPDLIFLDEPTTGFDPEARRQAWEVLANLRSLGKTMVLTTHYMDEVQYLADRVAVVAGGKIVATGTPSSLGGRDVGRALIRFRLPNGGIEQLVRERSWACLNLEIDQRCGEATIETEDPTGVLLDLTRWAVDNGRELEALTVQRPSLEDAYLALVSPSALTGSEDQ